MTYRILVTDEVDPEGVALLTSVPEFQVDVLPTQPPARLLEIIGDYHAFVGRSATKVSEELLSHAKKLKVIGRAGVGVDNVAIAKATELGIAVINAPSGNTIAVAELFFGALLGLMRMIPLAAQSMKEGRWDRSQLLGYELKGRTLGVIGVGRIGSEVVRRALAFGMEVVGYDPYIPDEKFSALRARRCSQLSELLTASDIVTVHTPLNDETKGLLGESELASMKKGAVVVNMARGGIVNDAALLKALESNQVAGAVLDVFAVEPLAADHPLRKAPRVVLMPHIGASTHEAQRNVAVDVCEAVRDALLEGELSRSLNVSAAASGEWSELQPSLTVAERAAMVARAILADRGLREIRRVSIRCGPGVIGAGDMLLAAASVGVLRSVVESDRLNLISARTLAEMRGLELSVMESERLDHPDAIEVRLAAGKSELAVQGVAAAGMAPRLTKVDGFHVDVPPRNTLIILTNRDVPGVIGRVGTLLGEARINIESYHQSRLAQGGDALAAISVDDPVPAAVREKLLSQPDIKSATVVTF